MTRFGSHKLLLELASTVILGFESRGAHGHILRSRDSGSHATLIAHVALHTLNAIKVYKSISFVKLNYTTPVYSIIGYVRDNVQVMPKSRPSGNQHNKYAGLVA
jgi:hypothetical protein